MPHDFLHLVPFAALPLPTAGDGAYLVDRYIAFMLPTATFLFASSLRLRLPTKVALIVGIDTFSQAGKLEHAEDEAAAVARLVEGSDLRLGSRGDGRYADIVRDLDEYSLVHIASHGAYIPHVPAASHVLLRGSRGDDDEPLTAAAVLGMRLNADLVVLSACNTATVNERGLPPDGDILGLPRSFLIAGAGGVIASLWSVDDRSTGVFFERFYRTLLDGEMPVEQALAITQRAMRLEYPDPHFWAPFVQIGVIVAPMEITD